MKAEIEESKKYTSSKRKIILSNLVEEIKIRVQINGLLPRRRR
jgi:hypothetical protein